MSLNSYVLVQASQASQESSKSVHFRRAPDSIIPRSDITWSSAPHSPLLCDDEASTSLREMQFIYFLHIIMVVIIFAEFSVRFVTIIYSVCL